MALIDWNDSLSINIVEIDNQHKKLISIINRLHDAMRSRNTKDMLGELLDDLNRYTIYHFSTEEKYFKKVIKYKEAKAHQKKHEYFINRITEFNDEFKNGNLFLSLDIMNFLKKWLVDHIRNVDIEYSSYFQEVGI